MTDKTMKFGEAPEEKKNEILEKMREHGIMLPNINAWGYDKAIAKVEALIAAKTAQNKPETPETHDAPATETPAEEIKEEKKPHYDGLCHICRSAVYDGVCSGCGFTLRR